MTLRYDTRSRVSTYTRSWVGGEPDFGVFDSIATTVVGAGGTGSITFSSIPAGYKHLQLRFIARTDASGAVFDTVGMRFNSDSAANYSYHVLGGDGASAFAGGYPNESVIQLNWCAMGASTAANIFGIGVVDILDYADTNKFKTVRALNGHDRNGAGILYLTSGNWRSTSAITSITLDQYTGPNYVQYSHFALYGIKA